MKLPLTIGFVTMTLLALVLIALRARLASAEARLRETEEALLTMGLLDDDSAAQD